MADVPAHIPDLEPYRRRVAEIMRRPAQTIAEDAMLPAIAKRMAEDARGACW